MADITRIIKIPLPSGDATLTASFDELNFCDGVTSSIQTQLNAKAPLASPALTGTPTAPTATAGTNTTQIATTAFVKALGDTKADVDASNLTSGNVDSWQNKLKMEQLIHNFTVSTPVTSIDFDVSDGDANSKYIVEVMGGSTPSDVAMYLGINNVTVSVFHSSVVSGECSATVRYDRMSPDAIIGVLSSGTMLSKFTLNLSSVQNGKIHYYSNYLYVGTSTNPLANGLSQGLYNGTNISKIDKITIWCGSSAINMKVGTNIKIYRGGR